MFAIDGALPTASTQCPFGTCRFPTGLQRTPATLCAGCAILYELFAGAAFCSQPGPWRYSSPLLPELRSGANPRLSIWDCSFEGLLPSSELFLVLVFLHRPARP